MLLEPLVSQLYGQALDMARQNITSDQQLELARRLLSTDIQRKTMGDF